MSEEQTTAVVQDPVTPDPTVTAPVVPTPAPSSGPWDASLATRFEDEAIRGQVANYLREEIQPYTTRLEQQSNANEQAVNLWKQFETDPINTYVQVTHELLGEELATEFLEFAQQKLNGQEQQPDPTQQEVQQMALSQEDQAAINWARAEQAKSFYNEELARVAAQPENQDLLSAKGKDGSTALDHIAPFVHAAGGDFDQAAAMLRSFVNQWGIPQTPLPEVPDAPAPNVFGSDTATTQASTTPVEPKKQSINDAIDDFMREDKERRSAPPMGAV